MPVTGPRAGDRMPDLECVREDGCRTRLHAEIGSRWALLPLDASTDFAVVTHRHLGEAATAVLTTTPTSPLATGKGKALLVRPDGHLAWTGTSPATLDG
ncbi:hypothetical protein ACFUJR_31960 [Streptomyces sp. NPDC057271]|uniref:aromatic-ring hydroxylase C-terminal domain-containing protein n=1 Tax=Streptomyces sp. NPDC057271 TaxID=3346078 RepID=UPI0036438C33